LKKAAWRNLRTLARQLSIRDLKGGPGTGVGGITGLNQNKAINRKHPYRFRADRLSLPPGDKGVPEISDGPA